VISACSLRGKRGCREKILDRRRPLPFNGGRGAKLRGGVVLRRCHAAWPGEGTQHSASSGSRSAMARSRRARAACRRPSKTGDARVAARWGLGNSAGGVG
jgi:hypothetical protein